ncbi:Fc.00g030450.m01.CDS01 [Cosmosporella sp. VM-42]
MATNAGDDRLETASTIVTPIGDEKDLEAGSKTSVDLEEPAPPDPNIVNWEGPDDPANPMNWSMGKKTVTVVIVSAITFVTPLASSIFAPSIEQVMSEFHSTDPQLASFIVSVYLLGYCFGPLVIAPLSEMYGRLILYNICNVLFVVFNIACAKAPTLAGLIVFRLFAGLAGSCPVTLGAGTLADMISAEKRGAAMASWVMGPLLGPVIGPIAGGYLTEAKDWRWSFWVVAIVAGAFSIGCFIFMRETYHYTILNQKTKKLRKETGNPKLRSALDTGRTTKELFNLAIVRPSKMLLFSPIVFLLSLYMAIIYGYLYLLFTAMPAIFEGQYGFSTGSVGLSYLGIGVGSMIGLFIAAGTSDRTVTYLTKKNGGERKPEYRLPVIILASFFVPLGLFLFGWTAEKNDHWILPIIGTSFLGLGMICAFMAISVYLVDAYTVYAASAIAASTVFRSLLGALLPLAGGKMYDALGYGWGTSLLAFIAVAMIPVPMVFYKYGERIRQRNLFDVKF